MMRKGLLFVFWVAWLTASAFAQNARVQFIHNSADIDARTLDVYVGDSLWVDDFAFRTATAFQDLAAGQVVVTITPPNQTAQDSVVAQDTLNLSAGMAYVVMINGITQINLGKYVNPDPGNRDIQIRSFLIGDVREAATDPTKVEFIAFHGSSDAPAVDVLAGGATPPIISNLDYGQVSSYIAVDPGKLMLDLTLPGDNANVLASFEGDFTGMDGKSAVVFASGFLDPANNQGGQKLGLLAGMAVGSVMEFTSLTKGPIGDWIDDGPSDYQYDAVFVGEDQISGGHGVAVDKHNRIWIGQYFVPGLLVKNPDGTDAPFSPIDTLEVDGVKYATKNCRGLGVASDGNILGVFQNKVLIKIDVETGQALAAWEGPGSLTKPAVDSEGFIYLGKVVGVSPVSVINPTTFALEQEIDLPGAPGFTRGIEVSADGKDIWSGDLGESGGPVKQWHSEDLLTYNLADSIFTNTDGELIFQTQRVTMDWGPQGRLWVSVDNSYDVSDNSRNALIVLDFDKLEYKKVSMPDLGEGVGNGPRGVAFSASGDTAYVISWNANSVFRYVRQAAAVARVQFIHNAADIDARKLDVWVGDSLWVDDFSFRTATPFQDMPPGQVTVTITPPNQTAQDSIVAQVDLNFMAGQSYIAFINGITPINLNKYANPDTANRDITLTVFNIEGAKEAAADTGKVEFMAFHGATDAPMVDVLLGGTVLPIVNDLDYGQHTPYVVGDPEVVPLDITPANDNSTILASFEADLSGMAGKAVVIFASGFVDPVSNQGGQILALLAALPDGSVIEFKNITKGPAGVWKFAGDSDYQFDDVFVGEDQISGGHGVAVDKHNRIWIGQYFVPGLLVKNPDGTDAPFSPIDTLEVDGVKYATKNCRGLGVASDGNILGVFQNKVLIKIDVETGQALAAWEGPGSLTKPAVDSEGFIYLGKVVGVSPVSVINPTTFALEQEIDLPGAPGFTRGIEVSADGKDIWSGDLGESGGPVKQWHSEDLLTYNLADSIFTNTDGELIFQTQRVTMDWGPQGRLWVSVDNSYDVSDNSRNALIVLDFDKLEYKKVSMPDLGEGVGNGPRGVAFSASGDTAYVISWNANSVFRYIRSAVGVEEGPVTGIPTRYQLLQNYPNPFNPSTVIPFDLPAKGHVVLKVFDTLGREVRTLLDQDMPAGRHQVVFDASALATGIYYYRLNYNGKVLSRKMLLTK